ncbi:DUF2214 family protein [Robertkochia flava]|uniref:DUF2214 family protein n=1 Tax=Robertkochia flava TaxID=3447986 RepID=UPI001CCF4488|nr:DUF2214 family protein [Robertkochia marina]
MNTYLLFRYLHLLFLIIMVGCVIAQQFMIGREMSGKAIRQISFTDLVYGISAILVVAFGLTLWFGVGKPSEYYNGNTVFLMKIALFIIVGILSIYPTIFYQKQKKSLKNDEITPVPRSVILIVRTELILLLFIPLLAVLMAAGTGSGS